MPLSGRHVIGGRRGSVGDGDDLDHIDVKGLQGVQDALQRLLVGHLAGEGRLLMMRLSGQLGERALKLSGELTVHPDHHPRHGPPRLLTRSTVRIIQARQLAEFG